MYLITSSLPPYAVRGNNSVFRSTRSEAAIRFINISFVNMIDRIKSIFLELVSKVFEQFQHADVGSHKVLE